MNSFLEFIHVPVKMLFLAILSLIKVTFVLLLLTVGTLVAGQSSEAPVSFRLITSYAMEYGIAYLKPYRHFFPEPFLIDMEQPSEE